VSARGEQDMPAIQRWDHVAHQPKIVSVIQDQQPSGMLGQPAVEGDDHLLLIRLAPLWQVQELRDRH
jgi:hypothetical protein